MNYLAHLLLSGDNNEIKLGNFIGDAVKGNAYKTYSINIQKGIILHRKIDSFTDNHKITKEMSSFLKEEYRKYSGIVVDIFYDYFLANNWDKYSNQGFEDYISDIHTLLLKNFNILPPKMKRFLPFLIARKRLASYKRINGIKDVLDAMSRYTSLPNKTDFAIKILKENHSFFDILFHNFYKDIDNYVKNKFDLLDTVLKN